MHARMVSRRSSVPVRGGPAQVEAMPRLERRLRAELDTLESEEAVAVTDPAAENRRGPIPSLTNETELV